MDNVRYRYSMLIEWSDDDRAYLVTLPEWAERVHQPVTHGDTYEQAVIHAQEVLIMLVEQLSEEGLPLPTPRPHHLTIAAD